MCLILTLVREDDGTLNFDCWHCQTDPNISQELLETNDQFRCEGIILEPKITSVDQHQSVQNMDVYKEEGISVSAYFEETEHTAIIGKPEVNASTMQGIMEPTIGKDVSEDITSVPYKAIANALDTEGCRVSSFADSVVGHLENAETFDLLSNVGVLKGMVPMAEQVKLRANKGAKAVRRKVTTSVCTNRVIRGLPVKESLPQAMDARQVRLLVVYVLIAGFIVALDGSTLSAVWYRLCEECVDLSKVGDA